MEIHTKKKDESLAVSVMGRLDAVSAAEFDKEMVDQINKGESHFILDLSRVDYISSAGLRCILALSKKLKEMKGEIVLCGLQGGVKEVFDISGFSSIFTIYRTLEDALKGKED
jgi:anti-anti-sigma factor